MRAWLALLVLVPALAGCSDEATAPQSTFEGFVATYGRDGQPVATLTLDGPADRLGPDLVPRPAYRLRLEATQAAAWDDRDAAYFDGQGAKVRDDGCSIFAGACERWTVQWRPDFVPGDDVSATGAFWPLSDSPDLARSRDGDVLVIRNVGPLYDGLCWEYEDERPVPVRSCDGEIELLDYEARDLPMIPAWPAVPTRPAAGASQNELFPGAELDLQGHGYTSLEALDALRLNSVEARASLESGGCVVTTLFGRGSGGFGGSLVGLGETTLGYTSFTIQDADDSTTKYTLRWVRDALGTERFSNSVDVNSPDRPQAPSCAEAATQPWPAVGLAEFLTALSARFGPAGNENVEVSRQPDFVVDGPGLHYAYTGNATTFWGGAGFYFETTAGRMAYASYIGDNDLEP